MTDAHPTLAHGDEYIVIYRGGPNDGQIDTRISTDGGFDTEITVLTAVGGKETLTDYNLVDFAEVGGKYHVNYDFDAKDSEPFDAPEDRGDRQ
ncbi:MAG: oligoribonuclease [Actinomycetota bacterium]